MKKGTRICKQVKQCKRKCPNGLILHPRKFCKCVAKPWYDGVKAKYNALLARCGGPAGKWARCGGKVKKCTMYQQYNWGTCKCERRNYCEKGCTEGFALHPSFNCKCIEFLDEAIPSEYLLEANDGAKKCDENHYYNENADYCVAFNWCPKWNECGADRKWDQNKCDCVWDAKPIDVDPVDPV